MLIGWARSFATKRSIPYAVKNNWKLPVLKPTLNDKLDANVSAVSQTWGSSVTEVDPKNLINVPKSWRRLKTLPQWKKQMFALKEKFPEGWNPKRKLDREEMARLKEMKRAQPHLSLNVLGDIFKISPEAVRRIIKSNWKPTEKQAAKLKDRWTRRGLRLGSWKAQQAVNQQETKLNRPNNSKKNESSTTKAQPPRAHSRKFHKKLHDPGQFLF